VDSGGGSDDVGSGDGTLMPSQFVVYFARWGRQVLHTAIKQEDNINKITSLEPMLKAAANTNDHATLRYTLEQVRENVEEM
jgi:hypothetical protein